MKIETIEEIIGCLPAGKTMFPYYEERYASMLLMWVTDSGASIADLKRTPFAPLLKRPSIQKVVKQCGSGQLEKSMLDLDWSQQYESFLLTLGHWGKAPRRYQQTTRPGYNLVLHVNLDYRYQRTLQSLFTFDEAFQYGGHPVLRRRQAMIFRQTLAWVRMDLDLTTNEVLIEEIQSDFLRVAIWLGDYLRSLDKRNARDQKKLEFCELILERFQAIWREAVMAAALWFIREELGMNTVWYHTHLTGAKLKRIEGKLPPRSLYSRLPRQFCFERTHDRPEFLLKESSFKRDLRRIPDMEFYRLRL